jgi:hypothetical protein
MESPRILWNMQVTRDEELWSVSPSSSTSSSTGFRGDNIKLRSRSTGSNYLYS